MPLFPGVLLEGIDCKQLKHSFTLIIIPSHMSLSSGIREGIPSVPKNASQSWTVITDLRENKSL